MVMAYSCFEVFRQSAMANFLFPSVHGLGKLRVGNNCSEEKSTCMYLFLLAHG